MEHFIFYLKKLLAPLPECKHLLLICISKVMKGSIFDQSYLEILKVRWHIVIAGLDWTSLDWT